MGSSKEADGREGHARSPGAGGESRGLSLEHDTVQLEPLTLVTCTWVTCSEAAVRLQKQACSPLWAAFLPCSAGPWLRGLERGDEHAPYLQELPQERRWPDRGRHGS